MEALFNVLVIDVGVDFRSPCGECIWHLTGVRNQLFDTLARKPRDWSPLHGSRAEASNGLIYSTSGPAQAAPHTLLSLQLLEKIF